VAAPCWRIPGKKIRNSSATALHVGLGLVLIPVVIAKLWSVVPRLVTIGVDPHKLSAAIEVVGA